jgi:hypothetical protein
MPSKEAAAGNTWAVDFPPPHGSDECMIVGAGMKSNQQLNTTA